MLSLNLTLEALAKTRRKCGKRQLKRRNARETALMTKELVRSLKGFSILEDAALKTYGVSIYAFKRFPYISLFKEKLLAPLALISIDKMIPVGVRRLMYIVHSIKSLCFYKGTFYLMKILRFPHNTFDPWHKIWYTCVNAW